MADIFSKEKRSEIISRIRPKNTKIENLVFSALRSNKIYFQKHYKKAAGSPDVALPKRKRAIFIASDFWHGHQFSRHRDRLPKFWRIKIQSNINRDRRNRAELRRQGWLVLRVWERQLQGKNVMTLEKIISFLRQ